MSAHRLLRAAEIRNGMHMILDDGTEWRVMGVQTHPDDGSRSFFLTRDGDVTRSTRQDTDLILCIPDKKWENDV